MDLSPQQSARKRILLGSAPEMPTLLDLSMPGMSGQQVLAELRAVDPQAKVSIMAGYIEDESALSDAQAVMRKPVTLQELLQTVRTILDAEHLDGFPRPPSDRDPNSPG